MSKDKALIKAKEGSFCTLGILIFSGFATSCQIGLLKQNENDGVTQTSERTLKNNQCFLYGNIFFLDFT